MSKLMAIVLLIGASFSGLERPNFNDEIKSGKYQSSANHIRNHSANPGWSEAHPSQPFDEEEALKRARSLVSVINQHRREHGLDEIPYSPWLTYVARFHVYDLETNDPTGGSCNLHSWSNKGSWSPCCYTGDHAKASCMWNKPRELSDGAYKGNGYEIAARNEGGITIYGALEQWKGSSGHLDVILNRGMWSDKKWKAIGAAISNHNAVVWFGD